MSSCRDKIRGLTRYMVLAGLLLVGGCTAAPEPEALPWGYSLGLALEAAKAQERDVLVSFDASWCTICARMKRDTFQDDVVRDALGAYVLLSVDVDAQPHLAQKYLVDAVPQQVILRADGAVLARAVGYLDPGQMTRFLAGDEAAGAKAPTAGDVVLQ